MNLIRRSSLETHFDMMSQNLDQIRLSLCVVSLMTLGSFWNDSFTQLLNYIKHKSIKQNIKHSTTNLLEINVHLYHFTEELLSDFKQSSRNNVYWYILRVWKDSHYIHSLPLYDQWLFLKKQKTSYQFVNMLLEICATTSKGG